MSQAQRARSTSLLQVEKLAGTNEVKKKRKRLSFRALGSARPSISSKRPTEPPIIADGNKLTVIAPNERGNQGNSADGALSIAKPEKVVVEPPPPPPEPVDRRWITWKCL